MSEYRQKEIAMINDLSGYGRYSLTVAIPIISAMKVRCCPVPTSILSNHTGFPVYFFDDYTEKMPSYIEKWKELDLSFDGIINGFLGSEAQIAIVMSMIREPGGEETRVIIDPVMGDHGQTCATFTPFMCRQMKDLVSMGDIVVPNLTRACILTGRPFRKKGWTREELKTTAADVQAMGPESVVITGVNQGGYLVNTVAEGRREVTLPKTICVGQERPDTGDVFPSVVAAATVRGWDLEEGVRLTASFVKKCIGRSEELDIPATNGVCFGEPLDVLVWAIHQG